MSVYQTIVIGEESPGKPVVVLPEPEERLRSFKAVGWYGEWVDEIQWFDEDDA